MIDGIRVTYYLLDVTHPAYDTRIQELNTLHRATYPDHNLSITYSNDITRCLVKVVNNTLPSFGGEYIMDFDDSEMAQVETIQYTNPKFNIENITELERTTREARIASDDILLGRF